MNKFMVTLYSDILTIVSGIPFGGTLSAAVEHFYSKRIELVRNEITDNLMKGNISGKNAAKRDDFIAGVLRIHEAISCGEAEYNLQLLSRALVGKMQEPEDGEEFSRYVPVLTRMHPEIAFVVGRYIALLAKEGIEDNGVSNQIRHKVWHRLIEEARARYKDDGSQLQAYCSEASGLGLLIKADEFFEICYKPTKLAFDLSRLRCLDGEDSSETI